jgi:hypothetical protein
VRRTNSAAPSRPTSRARSRATHRTESGSSGVANASCVPAVATVVRSGRSSSSHVSTNPTATTQAATRNTRSSASVNAEMNVLRAAAGSSDRADGSSVPTSACAPAAPASRSSSRLVKIEPRIAVPTEPPIDRNSVAPEVATPSCSYGTAFWTASTSTCMTIPSPRPTTNISTAASPVLVPASIVLSASIPAHVTAVPAIGHAL